MFVFRFISIKHDLINFGGKRDHSDVDWDTFGICTVITVNVLLLIGQVGSTLIR